ncbi:MAG: glycosyltransferase [Candidatus Aminicenantes bacterium]|nr:glycosyltransferase [Candidatus Aminicenantes bacterium]
MSSGEASGTAGAPGARTAAVAEAALRAARTSPPQAAYNLLLRAEVAAGWRKPTLALYDHTLHLIGGGEKYGCTLAAALQDDFDITLIAHKPLRLEDLGAWYDLDLSRCRVEVMPLEFFESRPPGRINPDLVSARIANPFLAVARRSGDFDFFVNNSMLEMVCPLANVSVFVCHFPERHRGDYFYVPLYRHLVYNSRYTAAWIEKKWQLAPQHHIYPPVEMLPDTGDPEAKEKVILSVARFESGGSKQQAEMVDAFARLRTRAPGKMSGWKLVLCGGSDEDNPYLERLRSDLAARPGLPVELRVNIPLEEIRGWYRRAAIFWHLCGLNRSNPAHVEHFGMSTVEAMQNGCLPIVFDGGGQREIVTDGLNGFRVAGTGELLRRTLQAAADETLRRRLGEEAHRQGRSFQRAVFSGKVRRLFGELAAAYASGGPL